jgi:ribonuclease J
MGLIIDTPLGKVVHSGDFKIDKKPVDGKRFDESRIRKLAKENVLLLMSDSTNVERPGWSTSENEVSEGLRRVIKSVKRGKCFVALFASNVHRVQTVVHAAMACGRRVALCGRSMHTNVEIAARLGVIKLPKNSLIPAESVMDRDPDKVLILSTGTQAEPRSALYRMSLNDHPSVKIEEGDTVIMSSRHIPGNEKAISHLINNLFRRGAHVIDSSMAKIHASGHAYQEEQKALLKWVKPRFFMPVHGEYRMLVQHAWLAEELDPKLRTLVIENGDVAEVTVQGMKKRARVPSGKIFLDEAAGDLHEELLRDRKQLAHTGLVVVSMLMNAETSEIVEGPDFDIRGVNDEVDLDGLRTQIIQLIQRLSPEARQDAPELSEEIRRSTRRFFYKANGVKPVVIPLVYEV